MKKRFLALCLSMLMVASMAACGNKTANQQADQSSSTSDTATQAPADTSTDTSTEAVTIKVFSNLTDRKSGQGLIEQTLIDDYMKENPNVTIDVEALDDEAYKTKFKAYASGNNNMPDLVSAWGQPSFLYEVIDAGILSELNAEDYKDYGFIEGSLNGFSKDGKLYGLPRNTDVMAFYYNKALFAANGWEVPKTYAELIALGSKIKDAGIIPVSMDGSDKWPLSIYVNDLVAKLEGDCTSLLTDSIANGDFSNPSYKKAAELLQEAVNAGLFQSGFETTDYGTARNLFANGQAAMYYMGSWEMSMATNEDVLQEVRDNIGVFAMPVVDGGKGKVTDITAWNGGGYAVSANSPVKAEAIKLLNYMFQPDHWSKLAWENGVCMSAQNYSAYLTGKETEPQKAFTDMVTTATSITGVTFNDRGNSEFKSVSEDLSQMLAIGSKTPDEFVADLGEAVKK